MTDPYQWRNPDGSLRLDEMLGERFARHYLRVLGSSSEEFAAMQLAAAVPGPAPAGTATVWHDPGLQPEVIDGLVLTCDGYGPEECSSSQALARLPEIVWDVCGYYRALGFHWTQFRQASTREIRLRYLEMDPRQEDSGLFYAAGQLLDPVIRRAYDLQPLGGLFLGDRNVRLMMEKHAALEAARRCAEAAAAGHPEDLVTQEDVLGEWGFRKDLSAAEARDRLRHDCAPEDAGQAPETALGATLAASWDQAWSWYRLAGPGDFVPADPAALEAWQAMVCRALSDRGVIIRFSVGLWPGQAPRVWRDSNKSCIFFLGKEQPTPHLAAEAAQGYLAQR